MTYHSGYHSIRAGVIGCGAIAPLHVQALSALPQVTLTGLVDPDPEAIRRLNACWTVANVSTGRDCPEAYPDLASFLQKNDPDVVHICTPHHTHVPLAVQALEAGCHVLMEKPPAISESGLNALSRAIEESGKQLGICFQNRFNLASRQAYHLIQTGKVGAVKTARAFVTWKRDQAYYRQGDWRGRWETEGGGVMINQAIHTLDLLIWLAGKPLRVEGSIANRHLRDIIEVEDTAELLLNLENNVTALFYATTAYGSDAPVFLELECDRARLRLEGDHLTLDDGSEQAAGERLSALLKQDPAMTETDRSMPGSTPEGKSCWGYSHFMLIQAFYHSLLSKKNTFPIDLHEGSFALRTLLALYASDRDKKPVFL
jgi:UDP-N-acetyl-2-amino-2-deoxyglucuronate dehydrogenase